MARKPWPRDLPALTTLHPNFHGWPAQANVLHDLIDRLRQTIDRVRTDQDRCFYPQTAVTRFFGVSPRTTTLAYQALVREGLLRCVRGSATHVRGRQLRPRRPPLGVVGIALWAGGFAQLPHWRLFVRLFEDELRRRNFVADLVFFENNTPQSELTERLLEHHLDCVVWPFPPPAALPTFELLADGGVPTVAVIDEQQLPERFSQITAEYTTAYRQGLDAWQRAGVTAVVVCGDQELEHQARAPVNQALARTGLRVAYRSWPFDFDGFADGTAVILPHDLITALICRHRGEAIGRLLRRCRVMAVNSLPIPAADLAGVSVHLVRLDWEGLARQVANTVTKPNRPRGRTPAVVRARWLGAVPARDFAEIS